MDELENCTCHKEDINPHPCPYAMELHDDSETLCECCKHCTEDCAMDI